MHHTCDINSARFLNLECRRHYVMCLFATWKETRKTVFAVGFRVLRDDGATMGAAYKLPRAGPNAKKPRKADRRKRSRKPKEILLLAFDSAEAKKPPWVSGYRTSRKSTTVSESVRPKS